jgi:hypothetical protein
LNSEEFKKVVAELKKRPMPGKHVYVWNGDENALIELIGKELTQEFDLAKDLQVDGSYEYTETGFPRLIEKSIERKLFEFYSEVNDLKKQQILIVSSSSILSRYKIGLAVFYDYYVGDRTMVVFVVSKPQVLANFGLPDYVRYEPDETLKYLGNLVQPENIVE